MLNGKKVLVTGAGGFIGSHLVEALLAKGAEVRAFVKYNGRGDWGMISDLPVEAPEAFLYVNQKTAQMIGIEIPTYILEQAYVVIREESS